MIRRSQCVCVCVFTQISHISKLSAHFFEGKYMQDAADNRTLSEQITIFPKMGRKPEYILIQFINCRKDSVF